ncbi:MAG TPA: HAMP domain-containing sensor histidine kinase [Candidatus Eremiobacteraceae bacterium]|nr:HAMP domain-containing sensor histidine kinase [Candidatus Eremiobacteraceae bacterium]
MSDRSRELIHDLRNRLAVAKANVEAFLDRKLAPTPARLKAVIQSLDQVDALIDELAPGPHAHDAPQEIDVCRLLDGEYRAVEAVAAEKNIAFEVHRCPAPSHACAHFIADPVRVGQIVSNVLLNAVRYTPEGGSIVVDCSRHGGQLEVSVSDSGPGVASGEEQRIFERGVRGAAARTAAGSGYGLAIAKEFVEAAGGTIAVSNASDRGARFVVRLPGTPVPSANGCAACDRCRTH